MTYYEQETNYTCGPACMRMVLAKIGIEKSEKEVAKLLGTNKVVGTKNKDFVNLAEKYKLQYSVHRNSSITNLNYFFKKGYQIIICYFHPKEKQGHYAVIRSMRNNKITLMDPIDGPNHTYSIKNFEKYWKSTKTFEGEKAWFIAIKK